MTEQAAPSVTLALQCHDTSNRWLSAIWKCGIGKWPEKLLPLDNPGLNVTSDTFGQNQKYLVTLHIWLEPDVTPTVQSHLPYLVIFLAMSFQEIPQVPVLHV